MKGEKGDRGDGGAKTGEASLQQSRREMFWNAWHHMRGENGIFWILRNAVKTLLVVFLALGCRYSPGLYFWSSDFIRLRC